MAKGGATISKIVEETKRQRGTVATILRKYRLRENVFQTAKRSGRPHKDNVKRPSLMIRDCMSHDGAGPLIIVNGSVTDAKYLPILQKQFLPVVAMYLMTTHQSIEPGVYRIP